MTGTLLLLLCFSKYTLLNALKFKLMITRGRKTAILYYKIYSKYSNDNIQLYQKKNVIKKAP